MGTGIQLTKSSRILWGWGQLKCQGIFLGKSQKNLKFWGGTAFISKLYNFKNFQKVCVVEARINMYFKHPVISKPTILNKCAWSGTRNRIKRILGWQKFGKTVGCSHRLCAESQNCNVSGTQKETKK